ncbi:GntR family transcriptional regulator [Brachybacterium huguangmaarense]|uniref:GntR family transcriptional regulator n=1 Tax=Brachybacterium huguangmaarense TaxID=1652028 RepID=A0ABY6G4H3_9MICO|nr:GntR family transcriptional regulator [Brachybacterium huguangmaarense]UYG17859.1 GntR family transcriptional regulator [Brachybacterium huguangmaarense]
MSQVIVDLADPTPPYEQIRRAVLDQVRAGRLRPGDRLPTIRSLARDLGLAPGTVGRAYKELEEADVLVTGRGAGTRIADPVPAAVLAATAADPAGSARVAPLAHPSAGPAGAGVRPDEAAIPVAPELHGLMTDAVDAARSDGYGDPEILEAVRQVLAGSRARLA